MLHVHCAIWQSIVLELNVAIPFFPSLSLKKQQITETVSCETAHSKMSFIDKSSVVSYLISGNVPDSVLDRGILEYLRP